MRSVLEWAARTVSPAGSADYPVDPDVAAHAVLVTHTATHIDLEAGLAEITAASPETWEHAALVADIAAHVNHDSGLADVTRNVPDDLSSELAAERPQRVPQPNSRQPASRPRLTPEPGWWSAAIAARATPPPAGSAVRAAPC